MQVLICHECETTWEREPKRGRKPKLCPSCQNGSVKSPSPPPKPSSPEPKGDATPKKRRRKTKWAGDTRTTPLDQLPFADRTGGWCTDYDPLPKAQHHKCPYDLWSHRCPCECHEE